MIRHITIRKFADLTGYTEKAVYNKINDGTWAEGDVWTKAADGRVLMNIEGYNRWVETGGALRKPRKAASKSPSRTRASSAGSAFASSPPPLI
ncbi:excisionase [Ralstonia pickettii]|nr:excisionase [Ralstonia pickettii]MBB0100128.1 excisionase [Ralstonia pickettii]MBB0110086.1 excisionase [Ralstonia pickettii]MBB0131150.1 excisionase [Ralstonia pickettii]MBB0164762.1 excisionase [Ralstonia pickettii]